MGFFDRFRSSGRSAGDTDARDTATAEQSAIRLIDEGNALEREGQFETAMQRYQSALEIAPQLARAHLNCGNILLRRGDAQGALSAFDTAAKCNPDYAAPHFNKGNLLHDLKDFAAAIASFRRALELNPGLAVAHNNLGLALKDNGQSEQALVSFRDAIANDPDFVEAHFNLANLLKDLGTPDLSLASYRKVLKLKPDHALAHYNLGHALQQTGKLNDAVEYFKNALHLAPEFAQAHFALGNAWQDLGELTSAEQSYRRCIKANPEFAGAHNNLGNVLEKSRRTTEATQCYLNALAIDSSMAVTHNNLACSQTFTDLESALSGFRRALEIKPDYVGAHNNLLFNLVHSEASTAESLFIEHTRFGTQFEAPLREHWPKHANTRDPLRRLKVGFVSADFCGHAVAHFFEPVITELAKFATYSLYAYHNGAIVDDVTQRLRKHFACWNTVFALTDEALAQKIVDDGIDILIDLSGHTGNNRLLTFARKPAPVQLSWIGHPSTTGLRAIDYFLTDRHLTPPGIFDNQFTEKLVYLPVVAPFLLFDDAPPVNPLPALSNGYLTFGSFHKLSKLNRAVVALWSKLLKALPDSRICLGNMPAPGEFNPLIDWFVQEGIARDRLNIYPRSDIQSYLELHQKIDICLDTFPFSGYTVTHLALLMGVPTLSLPGKTPATRQGLVALAHVGLEDFAASSAEDFIQKGASWATDLASLARLRAGMRRRIAESPDRQPEFVVGAVARAFRIMWERWCAHQPAESFVIDP